MTRVTLYSRPGCRLCEEARQELESAVPQAKVEVVDVDSQPALRQRLGLDIPVAESGGRELFRHRFDPACVEWLQRA